MSFWPLVSFAAAILSAGLALTVALERKRSVAHWSFLVGMLALAAESTCSGFAAKTRASHELMEWSRLSLLASAVIPGVWLIFALTYARADGPELLRRFRGGILAAIVGPLFLGVVFFPELLMETPRLGTGQEWVSPVGMPGLTLSVLCLLGSILVLMDLEATYRSAVGTMRWRIKFMILGLLVLFSVRAYTTSQYVLFDEITGELQTLNSGALLLGGVLMFRTLRRPGHFEVAVRPPDSVFHQSLTILLAGVYLFVVGVVAKLLAFLEGGAAFELKAFLVLAILVGATLLLVSDRVRLYRKRLVSRYLERPAHDYRSIWRTFTEATSRRLEQGEFCGAVVKLISEVFQVLSVTICLRDQAKDHLVVACSTSLPPDRLGQAVLDLAVSRQAIGGFAKGANPVDLDQVDATWARELKGALPAQFREGGHRICVPLVSAGELLGIIALGDRVNGETYSLQDFELLKSVADQTAAGLLNIQLTQQLAQAKQLEAFQAMSAFFVHDLKNTAATLSLTLQNLPVHYQDPAFREDALRAIGKSVGHINELIGRLTVLRHDLAPRAVPSDLNQLVQRAVRALGLAEGVEVIENLRPLPKVTLDPDQIAKVLTNLLLNAREALNGGGQVRVETDQVDGNALIAISDTGCGMSHEFLATSLFRPFRSTKKRGMGIGMFHCKMIVDAHRGRIQVESEVGKGSTFRVLLPI